MKLLRSKTLTYTTLSSIIAAAALFSGGRLIAKTTAPTNFFADIDTTADESATFSGAVDLPNEIPNKAPLRSDRSLVIEKYSIQHQGPHLLGIAVNCAPKPERLNQDFSEAPTIYSEINQFLLNYPNNTDYWEIVNRKLTAAILDAHPSLKSVTVSLKVFPTPREPYTRSTTVTRTSDGRMIESWSFITAQVQVPHHGGRKLNIATQYLYRDGITNAEYPDFIPIYHRIAQFLQGYSNGTASWEKINQDLAAMVLDEYPMMKSFTSKLEVLPTKSYPYRYFTTLTLSK